jgi:hypothetical protein
MGTFEAWCAFAEGKAIGFAFVALAVAVIAGNEAQSFEQAAPAWSAWIAMVAGVVSLPAGRWGCGSTQASVARAGWWSSILMSVWTLWFGVALMRSQADGV